MRSISVPCSWDVPLRRSGTLHPIRRGFERRSGIRWRHGRTRRASKEAVSSASCRSRGAYSPSDCPLCSCSLQHGFAAHSDRLLDLAAGMDRGRRRSSRQKGVPVAARALRLRPIVHKTASSWISAREMCAPLPVRRPTPLLARRFASPARRQRMARQRVDSHTLTVKEPEPALVESRGFPSAVMQR